MCAREEDLKKARPVKDAGWSSETAWPFVSESACLSDRGRVRTNNEDACGAFPQEGVWCVADGMGGCEDGEVASAETIAAVASSLEGAAVRGADTASTISGLRMALSAASRRIFERARDRGLSGCGSTFVALVLGREPDEPAHALHAGDSRLYRIRGGMVRRITRDHSFVEAAGVRVETEVNPMFRSMILRAVGVEPDVALDDTPFDCRVGDRLILCSDGLTRMVGDADLATLTAGRSPAAATRALVDAANAAGGVDNVTAVVVDVKARGRCCTLGRLVVALLVLVAAVAVLVFIGRVVPSSDSGLPADDQSARPSTSVDRQTAAEQLLDEARAMELEAAARIRKVEEARP